MSTRRTLKCEHDKATGEGQNANRAVGNSRKAECIQRVSRSLKRVKKPNQLPLLLVGKVHLEAFVVEVNQLLQVLGRTVVEVRRSCSKAA